MRWSAAPAPTASCSTRSPGRRARHRPIVDRVADYALAEGDQLDLSAVTGAAFAAGQPAGTLVRVLQDDINGAVLQVDADGSAGGRDWTTIARLDGVHTGAAVNVVLSAAQPGGTTLTARDGFIAAPGSDFNADAKADLLLQNDAGGIHVLLMNGAQVISDQLAGQTSADWHISAPPISTATARPTSCSTMTTAASRSSP